MNTIALSFCFDKTDTFFLRFWLDIQNYFEKFQFAKTVLNIVKVFRYECLFQEFSDPAHDF